MYYTFEEMSFHLYESSFSFVMHKNQDYNIQFVHRQLVFQYLPSNEEEVSDSISSSSSLE